MNFPDPALDTLVVLVTLILTSVLDVLALNFFLQARKPRSHNKLKLTNEALARHQLAYPVWYITVMLVADFHNLTPHESVIVHGWMPIAAILSVLFWIGGLNGVAWQDDAILEHHKDCPQSGCKVFSLYLAFQVLILNSFLAAVSLALAIVFLQQPAVIHALTK
jgi:hypothetical protein